MNKFVLEPTDENLKLYQRVKKETIYWHTKDFLRFDPNLEQDFALIFDTYWELESQSKQEKEADKERKIDFIIAKMIVKLARKFGLSPQDVRDQFDNYTTVIFMPICIWRKDELGKMHYTLMTNLPIQPKKEI